MLARAEAQQSVLTVPKGCSQEKVHSPKLMQAKQLNNHMRSTKLCSCAAPYMAMQPITNPADLTMP
jgi:hypothetical protein